MYIIRRVLAMLGWGRAMKSIGLMTQTKQSTPTERSLEYYYS